MNKAPFGGLILGDFMTVKMITQSTTGSAVATACTVHGVDITNGASAGTVVINDGSGGSALISINSVAGVTIPKFVPIEGGGIDFSIGAYVTLTNAAAATLIYEQ